MQSKPEIQVNSKLFTIKFILMKTEKEKIESITLDVEQSFKERSELYEQLRDFKLSANKTDVVLKRMAGLTSTINSGNRRIQKLNEENTP